MKIASVLVIGLLAAMPVLGADKDGDDDEDPVVAAAVGKAAVSLEQGLAAGEAVAAHKDFRAVAAIPQRKDGRVVASVLLTNGKEWAKVRQPLDWGE